MKRVFVDTSAFMAVLYEADPHHSMALSLWQQSLEGDTVFYTSNYVLVETHSLLQNRFGSSASKLFEDEIVPILDVLWVEKDIHRAGMASVISAGRRNLSLVDCVSFELMRAHRLKYCFAFDRHFAEQGFAALS